MANRSPMRPTKSSVNQKKQIRKGETASPIVGKPVSPARLQRVFEKYKSLLLGVNNVESVAIGLKASQGNYGNLKKQQGIPCIVIYVDKKIDDDKLEKGKIPTDIEGVPTDIVVRPQVKLAAAPDLMGGLAVGRKEAGAGITETGSSCLIVVDNASGKSALLTCAHVAYAGGVPSAGESLLHPPVDVPGNEIGSGGRSGLGIGLDAAVVPLNDSHPVKFRTIRLVTKPIRPTVFPQLQMPVSKVGAKTNLTAGHVVGLNESLFFSGLNRSLDGLIKISPGFAQQGDSGSPVFTDSTTKAVALVGMIVGVEEGDPNNAHAYAHVVRGPDGVLDGLDVSLGVNLG